MAKATCRSFILICRTHANRRPCRKNPRKNRIVTLNSFQESSENTLDTVKFIIILALRTGNLDAQNIKQLISDTANKARKVITWRYADRPVLGAFAQGSGLVEDPETSAPAGQYTASLADAAKAAGLLAKLVGHDLRRGAAREVANLKRKPAGVGNTVVASALGHSRNRWRWVSQMNMWGAIPRISGRPGCGSHTRIHSGLPEPKPRTKRHDSQKLCSTKNARGKASMARYHTNGEKWLGATSISSGRRGEKFKTKGSPRVTYNLIND